MRAEFSAHLGAAQPRPAVSAWASCRAQRQTARCVEPALMRSNDETNPYGPGSNCRAHERSQRPTISPLQLSIRRPEAERRSMPARACLLWPWTTPDAGATFLQIKLTTRKRTIAATTRSYSNHRPVRSLRFGGPSPGHHPDRLPPSPSPPTRARTTPTPRATR